MAEHVDLTDPELHEPKGIAGAGANQHYVSDGAGSGSWEDVPEEFVLNPAFEVLIEGASAIDQNPTGLGTANAAQISFGAAQASVPISCDNSGTFTVATTGTYFITFSAEIGRTGGAGVAEVFIRLLLNGTQVGASASFKLDDSDTVARYDNENFYNLVAGDELRAEIMRLNGSNNSGGLIATTDPEGSWNMSPSAAYRIGRLSQ